MKIARQSPTCVRTPPSAGPSAAPNVPVVIHSRAPRDVEPVRPPRIDSAPARTSAAPKPCTQRKTISAPRLHAAAQPIEPAVKKTSPTRVTSRTCSLRVNGTSAKAATQTTRLYDVITQDTATIEVLNAPYRLGSARTTIDESAKATATEAPTAIVRRRVRPGLWRTPVPVTTPTAFAGGSRRGTRTTRSRLRAPRGNFGRRGRPSPPRRAAGEAARRSRPGRLATA